MPVKTSTKTQSLFLSNKEIDRLTNAQDNFRDRCLLKLIVSTDLNRSELSSIRIDDIDVNRKEIKIHGIQPRVIQCDTLLIQDIQNYIGVRTGGVLFLSNRGKPLSSRQISYILESAGEKAGLKNPNPNHKHINITCLNTVSSA